MSRYFIRKVNVCFIFLIKRIDVNINNKILFYEKIKSGFMLRVGLLYELRSWVWKVYKKIIC